MRLLFCSTGMAELRQMIADRLPDHQLLCCTPETVADHLPGVDIVTPFMTPIDVSLLEVGHFGFIQQIGVGLEGVDIPTATNLGVLVARMPSAGTGNAESVAEHAVMLMLLLSRKYHQAQRSLADRVLFAPRGTALLGKRVCIVGLGDIGVQIALRLRSFGMELSAVRANPRKGSPSETGVRDVYGPDQLHTALRSADYVVLAVNYDSNSHHLINDAALAAMKPGAFLINIARGGLIDPDALRAALATGHIAGAGLDVFWEEPVDIRHPLFRQNVIATPHHAGVTDLFYQGVADAFAENIRRFARGEIPLYTINIPPQIRGRA